MTAAVAPAIRVEGLSKRYRIGRRRRAGYRTFRETLVEALATPFRRWVADGVASSQEEDLWALKDVSFDVREGEVLGVIGRNGAGKSTLLKVLSRITEPTEGRASIRGRVASLLEVGTGFHPELTGRENVFLNGAILGMKRREIERKFDEIVSFAEIEKFLETPVKHYSTGMYMRLAFSVAAHLEPEILLVDEVLAVGDAAFQKKCLGKMGDVARGGRTVLFVSHNMNAIEQLCRRALLLEGGRVAELSADVRAVVKQYLFERGTDLPASRWEGSAHGRGGDSPWFRPTRFYVASPAGDALPMPAANDAEMWLRVEGTIPELDPALTIGYAIYSEDGQLVYWSFHTDAPEGRWPKVSAGRFSLVTRLPSRLLNEGTYRIELLASLHYRTWILEPGGNAPTIFITIRGGLSDSPHWMVRRPGLLAPVFEWSLAS